MHKSIAATIAVALAVATLVLTGCATCKRMTEPTSDLSKAILAENPEQATRLKRAMTDQDIANMLDMDIHAKLPTALAIARLASDCPGSGLFLNPPTGEELEQWQTIAARQDRILGVQPVGGLLISKQQREPLTLRDLREAAALTHCELLLVYTRGESNVENFNDAAALYWTFVGLWLSPGTTLEHKTVMQGALIDCRTGAVLGTIWSDSLQKAICPAAVKGIQESKLANKSRAEALAGLQKDFAPLLAAVVAKAEENKK